MELFPGYAIQKKLYQNEYYTNYLVAKIGVSNRYVIKYFHQNYFEANNYLQQQFDSEIVLYDKLLTKKNVIPLFLEDFGSYKAIIYNIGNKLFFDELKVDENNKIESSFKYLKKITASLSKVHSLDIGHNNLTPYNILLDKEEEVYFYNFIEHNKDIMCDYKYISPELTDKIRRPKTVLSDFYSLGVIFYEFLYAHPIHSENVKSLRRAHLTMNFLPLHKQNNNIPIHLSRIIYRLLHKLPSMRYQNCFSLEYDIEKIQEAYISKNEAHFTLGEFNHISEIDIKVPQNHFKRLIDDIFYEIRTKGNKRIFIKNFCGNTEQGLDFFVRLLMDRCNKHFFINFSISVSEASKKNPFHTISILLKKIIYNIKYSRDDDNKIKLIDFLENSNPRILSTLYHLCPDLNVIHDIGSRLDRIDVLNDRTTIYVSIKKFLMFTLQLSRPLIFHFPNINNIDSDTLKLFIYLCRDKDLNNIFFLFSTNNDMLKVESIGNIPVDTYPIPNMDEESVSRYLTDTFISPIYDCTQMSKRFFEISGGNLYKLSSVVKSAYQNKAIYFDKQNMNWDLNNQLLQSITAPNTYSDYLEELYESLSPTIQSLLRYASLMGNVFDVKTLSIILKVDMAQITKEFWDIEQHNLVFPISQFSKLKNTNNISIYIFGNIEIWNFFISKTSESEKKITVKIFKSLLDICEKVPTHFIIFEDFLYNNKYLINKLEEKHIYTLMGFFAGKAKTFVALRKMLEAEVNLYYCFSLLKPISWLNKYYLTKEIYYLGMIISLKNKNFELFEKLSNDSSKQLLTSDDKILFNYLRINYYIEKNQYSLAQDIINQSLTILNVEIPIKISIDKKMKFLFTSLLFSNKVFNDEIAFAEVTHSKNEADICKLNTLSIYVNDIAYKITLNKILYNCVKTGIKDIYNMPLLKYSKHLIDTDKNKKLGFKIANTVIETSNKVVEMELEKQIFYYVYIYPHIAKTNKSKEILNHAIEQFLNYGNYKMATHLCFQLCVQSFLGIDNLTTTILEVNRQIEKIHNHARADKYYKMLLEFKALCSSLTRNDIIAELNFDYWETPKSPIASYWRNLGLMFYYFYTNDMAKSQKYLEVAKGTYNEIESNFTIFYLLYYEAIIILETNKMWEKAELSEKISNILIQLKDLSKQSPDLFYHKYLYINGLIFRNKNKYKQMINCLSKCVTEAARGGYKNIEALANRRLSEYYKNKDENLYKLHLIKSYNNYKTWGNNVIAQRIKLENMSVFEDMEIRIFNH